MLLSKSTSGPRGGKRQLREYMMRESLVEPMKSKKNQTLFFY